MTTVQYRITGAPSGGDLVAGDDGADVIVTVPYADATLDPNVAYMQGRLKTTGDATAVLDLLASGDLALALRALLA